MLKPSFRGFISFAAFLCCFIGGNVIAQEAGQPVPVDVTAPRRVTIVSEKSYTGHLQPQAEVKVFANIPGKLVALHVEVGQSVAKGEALAQSNVREANIATIKAEVALSVAQSNLTTTEANAQTRVESQLATAQERVMATQAQLEETKSLAEMRIRNQLTQAEAAYQAAVATIERSKINAEQALERAKAERDKADLDFERNKALHNKKHISNSDFESAENRLKVAQTRYEEAVATAAQFKEGITQPAVEKAKAELAVARKVVESRGWEREIASAESNVTQAQANLRAAEKLVTAKAWEREIAIATAAVTEAEEHLKLAQEKVTDATITSPIDGVIAARHLGVGDYAPPAALSGGQVFTVVGIDVPKAVWTVPAEDISRIERGNMALISTASGIQNIVGTIDFISPIVNRENNTVLVHATVSHSVGAVSNSDSALIHNSGLKPGTPVTVTIKTGERKNVQLLPRRAVLQIQNGSGTIFTVEGNVARQKQVTVGAIYGGEIEITSRLTQKTQVIVNEQHRLQEGTRVSVTRD